MNQFTLMRSDSRDCGDRLDRVLDSAVQQRGESVMRMKDQANGASSGAIESLDAWMKIRAARQVAEYIHELTAELTAMARSANCRSLASLLQIASLEAKKLSQEHGCEDSLNAAREETFQGPAWMPNSSK